MDKKVIKIYFYMLSKNLLLVKRAPRARWELEWLLWISTNA